MGARRFVARQRRRAAQVAWRLALGPVSGTTPRKDIRSIARRSWEPAVAAHVEEIAVVSDAHVEHYDFGRPLPVQFTSTKGFDTRHRYTLRDVCVSPSMGLVWFPGGPILEESVGSLPRLLAHERWMLEEPLLPPRRTIEGTVTVLPVASYYHWILECLPRALQSLEAEPEAILVVPTVLPRYAEEAIELLEFKNVIRSDEPVAAERLVLVGREQAPGWIRGVDIEMLRAAVLAKVGSRGAEGDGIYVSRRLARRSPLNEEELEQRVARQGLRVIQAEKLSFAEQVTLFSGASLVVGPHGAGLTNLVFADRLDRLVELFVVDHFNDCYARLAAQRGAAYDDLYCTGPDRARSLAPIEAVEAVASAVASEPRHDPNLGPILLPYSGSVGAVEDRLTRTLVRAARTDLASAELFEALAAAEVEALLLRGPAIARRLYREGERGYGDSDVLVPPSRRPALEDVLRELGYSPYTRSGRAQHWQRPDDRVQVDLHRTLWGVNGAPTDLWRALDSRRTALELNGVEVPVPGLSGTAFVVALHASQHGATVPHPLPDLERALSAFGAEIWMDAAACAGETRALQAFRQGLSLLPSGSARLAALGLAPALTPQAALRAKGIRVPDYLFEGLEVSERLSIIRKRLVPTSSGLIARGRPQAAVSGSKRLVAGTRRLAGAPIRMGRLAASWRRVRKQPTSPGRPAPR